MNEISFNELHKYMEQYGADNSIGDLTPTMCDLFGCQYPAECGATAIASVVDQAFRLTGKEGKMEKALIFCPDAVGDIHRQKYPEKLARVEKLAGFRFRSTSVMPSVTPVCFGTIFSGSSPDVHGIKKYEKPVLKVETLFDMLSAAGKNVAVISRNGCSIDKIFRDREIDYFSFRTDAGIFEQTRKLISDSDYDVIISYFMDYDHLSHRHGPYADEPVAALETAVQYFETLVADADKYWANFDRTVVWAPDHGNHIIDETSGGHGTNIPEDMVVNHFYRIRSKEA